LGIKDGQVLIFFFAFSRRISFLWGGLVLPLIDFFLSAAAIISLFKFIDTNVSRMQKLPLCPARATDARRSAE
jgi:hypothetical protein